MRNVGIYIYRSLFMVSVTALMTTGIVHERQSMRNQGIPRDAYVDTCQIINDYQGSVSYDIGLEYMATSTNHATRVTKKLSLNKKERATLMRIAMAEAEGEDTKGKALVMMVVLNRAYGDNEFPNSIYKVVHQKNQFSPVSNGRYRRVKPNKDCRKALNMVMSGWDESEGALYFESHKNPDNWHSRNLKYLFTHGGHRFYK